MPKKLNRRDVMKKMAAIGKGSLLAGPLTMASLGSHKRVHAAPLGNLEVQEPVTAITLGAGARGNVYGNYGVEFPNELKIVGVAEPIPGRNESYATKHGIPSEQRFVTWEHVFDQPKFADAVIISTPDHLHYGPCMQALAMGYDVLLEKPISPTAQECLDILALAKKTDRIVAVCHVLRYAPYFIELRKVIQSGSIGELVSIQHLEPIGHVHMAHSYVRGNWHNSRESTPIILGKSCHDLDILRWMIGEPCKNISAFGDLRWFKRANAPEGSTPRCTDGCAVEEQCPYSALKIYHRDRKWIYVFDMPDDEAVHGEYILNKLKSTNYGRCVYRMDNDQPDHYVTAMEFGDGITASFSMEALTSYHGRRTRVMGSKGDIVGDMEHFVLTDFLTGKATTWDITVEDVENYKSSGHGGGDWALVTDWVRAVKTQDPTVLTSTIDASVESHIMGFQAEVSRKNKQVMPIPSIG